MLFFCLNVIANGPSHSPDHVLKGVVSLPGEPDVSRCFAASPYQCTSTFGSATLPWTIGTWPVWPVGCTHSTLRKGGATDARAAPAPPAAPRAPCPWPGCCAARNTTEIIASTTGKPIDTERRIDASCCKWRRVYQTATAIAEVYSSQFF